MSLPVALRCGQPGCLRTTRDRSGLCHDHRVVTGSPKQGARLTLPDPVQKNKAPGGYDSRRFEPTVIGHREVYTLNGEYHRTDGPAIVDFDGSALASERYYRRGLAHREDGPAVVKYDRSGRCSEEHYYLDDVKHRLDGPALTHFGPEGEVLVAKWIVNGLRHREDGPAIVVGKSQAFIESGVGPSESYYLYDHQLTTETYARALEAIASGAPPEWVIAYAEGTAE